MGRGLIKIVTAASAAVSLGTLTPVASAQDALGQGNALDRNLNTQSGGRNTAQSSVRSEVQLRNALVTGNVAGGRGFRGDVGYSSPLDFRGATGSDDLFNFQSDSFYSGLATQNLRNIGGIQNTFSRSTLGQIGGSTGRFILERPSAGFGVDSIGSVATDGLDSAEGADGNLPRVDPFGRLQGTMRSTSSFYLSGTQTPQILQVNPPETEAGLPKAITASPLQGVREMSITSPALGYNEVSNEPLESITDSFRALGTTVEETGDERELRPGQQDPHRMIMNRLTTRVELMDDNSFSTLLGGEDVETEEVDGADPLSVPTVESPTARLERSASTVGLLSQIRDGLTKSAVEFREDQIAAQEALEAEDEPSEFQHKRLIDQAVDLLGGDEVVIDSLVNESRPDSTYKSHMDRGQIALKEARWFDAEERFTAALQAKRDAPLASAGRINAQIGAGMYRSASLNLRALYRTYPEMVNVRFDKNLLPTAERLTKIRDQLRERMRRDTAFARDAGLLLAYLGHQFASRPDVEEGFTIVNRVNASLGVEIDPLDAILERVWSE